MSFIRDLADRFKEPSSWAGVVGLLAAFGLGAGYEGYIQYGIATLAGLAGVLSILLKEKSA